MGNILFIPGLLNTASLFRAQQNYFINHYNVFIGDHTGHDSIESIAYDILNNQNMPQEFILGGLSMGGYIAMEILRQAPQRIKGLIIINSSAEKDTDAQIKKRLAFIKLSERGKFKGVTQHLLPNLVHKNALDNPLIAQVIFDMALETGQEVFARQQKAIMNRIQSYEALKKCPVPACVIVGDEDKLTPPALAQKMVDTLPDAQLHIIPECGHLSPLEYPDEVNLIIEDFIEAIL